nr:glycosyltransferase [Micrococcus sp. ACRRV]
MRIGVYSPWNTADPSAWSGVVLPMTQALADVVEVEVIPPVDVRDALTERLRARLRGMRGGRSLPTHTLASSRRRSAALASRLAERTGPPLDALVAIAASTDVLALPNDLPLIQVTDATFPAITGFYPIATGLGARNEGQGRAVERAGAAVTAQYVVASDWAARSLIHDVDVSPSRVTVAPFGPGTPVMDEPVARKLDGPLRVLAVMADWDRKRGDDVISAVKLARAKRPIELTVVGHSPDDLPSWVRREGVVPRHRLAELYAEHHVLVDLASANAAGVVMTDALISGLPVVATRVGGAETIVQDGVTGWLVDASDAIATTARVLADLDGGTVSAASTAALDDAAQRLTWTVWASSVVDAIKVAIQTAQRAASTQRNLVMVTPVLPSATHQEAAGEKLVREVVEALAGRFRITLLSNDSPMNRRAAERGGLPPHQMVTRGPHPLDRVRNRLGLGTALTSGDLSSLAPLISNADIVDLQWQEQGLLIPAVRKLAPDARIVVTLHDVLSQRFSRHRDMQPHPIRKTVWEIRRRVALKLESRIVHQADDVIVLSQKDADLLPAGGMARVHVVPPAIPGQLRRERGALERRADPHLLFVGFMARWANEEGIRWFASDVLPLIRAHVPGVHVSVVGGGLRDPMVEALTTAGVDVLGFVDDLEQMYDEADAVVVPLLTGAGVKFKVVEALVRGIPVVTTAVGSEGIIPSDAAHVGNSAEEFAAEVVTILRDPSAAEAHARAAAPQVADVFGADRFRARLQEIYR